MIQETYFPLKNKSPSSSKNFFQPFFRNGRTRSENTSLQNNALLPSINPLPHVSLTFSRASAETSSVAIRGAENSVVNRRRSPRNVRAVKTLLLPSEAPLLPDSTAVVSPLVVRNCLPPRETRARYGRGYDLPFPRPQEDGNEIQRVRFTAR